MENFAFNNTIKYTKEQAMNIFNIQKMNCETLLSIILSLDAFFPTFYDVGKKQAGRTLLFS